jgi:hypothetical protein
MRPKESYRAAADWLVESLGPFNAVHVRRGDFLRNELTKHKITRTVSVTGDEIVANLATRVDRDDQLVICTDGSPAEPLFGPIRRHFRHTVFLDEFLARPASRKMLAQLPRVDESVIALITQLVASRARVFIGTMFSTFTGLIQRIRGLERGSTDFFFTHNDFLSPNVKYDKCAFLPSADGPYSWNHFRFPLSPDAYSWVREWPESFVAGVDDLTSALLIDRRSGDPGIDD